MPASLDNQVQLGDGRILGYAEYGDPGGTPVFHFHGAPSSRLECSHPSTGEAAERLHVRLIVPDRPGMGRSDFMPDRTLVDWPDDVAGLAAALALDRLAVVGMSGGGPYVAACAYKIPHLLSSAGIISGIGPPDTPGALDGMEKSNRLQIRLARYAPWLLRLAFQSMARSLRHEPDKVLAQFMAALSEWDRAAMSGPDAQQATLRMLDAAFQQGARGAVLDTALCARAWGFRLQDIAMRVHLWHGEKDSLCPVGMGRYVAQSIPDCDAVFFPDDGHLSMMRHYDEVLAVVAEQRM